MTDYVDGKAAWLAEGLPVEGTVRDDERVGSLVATSTSTSTLTTPGDRYTVRPSELRQDVRRRLRALGEDAPDVVHVTTAKGRLLGTIEAATLLSTARA